MQAISRGLGFKATSSQLRGLLVERLKSLTERGLVRQQGPVLLVGNATSRQRTLDGPTRHGSSVPMIGAPADATQPHEPPSGRG